MNPPLAGESSRQTALDSPVTGRVTTVSMHDPESLYEQAKQRMAELHATADRRRVQARLSLLVLARQAFWWAMKHAVRGLFAYSDRLR
jgi:hypothetical protein